MHAILEEAKSALSRFRRHPMKRDSTHGGSRLQKRSRHKFAGGYNAEAVRLVPEGGLTVTPAARDLDLTDSSLLSWVKQAEIDDGKGPAAWV